MNILLIYPNKESYPMIPLGISVLAGVLRNANHSVEVFDTTFMMDKTYIDHKEREKLGLVEYTDAESYWKTNVCTDIYKELYDTIQRFKPKLIGFSIVENNYTLAKDLIAFIKQYYIDIPIIVGGIFPTVAPQFFINDNNVDILCGGEGERPLVELANNLEKGKSIKKIKGLAVKNGNKQLTINLHTDFYNWKPFSYQNWEVFDERHLLKPYRGKMWRTGCFELSRGCPHRCSFCINQKYQKLFKHCGKYRREKDIIDGLMEISLLTSWYNLELIWFHDENFLSMSRDRFKKFIKGYKRINLPFFIQTRADSLLDKSKLKALKSINCDTISIGVEVGNEWFRKTMLNKPIKNETYIKAFNNCKEVGIRTTANVMMGFPNENDADLHSTIDFLKKCHPDSVGLAILAPYYGTEIRKVCIKEGLIEDKFYSEISFYKSILKKTAPSLEHYYKNFTKLLK